MRCDYDANNCYDSRQEKHAMKMYHSRQIVEKEKIHKSLSL